MKINIVEALKNEDDVFTQSYNGTFARIDFLGEEHVFPREASVDANYQFDGEGVAVWGSFSADMRTPCARCLKEVLYTVEFDFTEYYKKQPEEGMYAYEGEIIDLTRMLEDNVVLNLPVKILCKESCKGLCNSCGKNLNEGECGCKKEIDETNPFYSLSKLYDDEEV